MRHLVVLFAAALLQAAPAHATAPLDSTVEQAYPQLEWLFQKLVAEGENFTLGGKEAFRTKDKYLPGKVAAGLADLLVHLPPDDPRLPAMLRDYARLADLTVGMDNETWGIYYYMGALHRLNKAGLLQRAVRPDTLAALRQRLDWRSFVRESDFTLSSLPTNYYGVAFSIARLRALMGWEDTRASEVLLDKMMKHYAAYSGDFGFSDETDGHGRFDRYSILLSAEICERFLETGMEVPAELKALLRKSADVALNSASADGTGFTMGRSLGPYGETAMLEILSTAAYLGVLSAEEKEYAYAYSARIAERYMRFWYQPELRSVDLWGGGRRTDAYRGNYRILGENFSLLHQLIVTSDLWSRAGMAGRAPREDLAQWLQRARPKFSLTRFAQGRYDRALATWRDGDHVFSLSMVNGGPGMHAHSPYYPLSFSHSIVSGIADSGAARPQLLPKFTLADGSELIATAFIQDIQARASGAGQIVSYRQDALTRLGQDLPQKDPRIRVDTEYALMPGAITRTDRYTAVVPVEVADVTLEFASFSRGATAAGTAIGFAEGTVRSFDVKGLASCQALPAGDSPDYRAPYGQMHTVVRCASGAISLREPLVVSWTIRY
ncbi:hypothetical protein [Pseudoduganella lutea]|uniref:Uncharacterized protein n=1 Tax=Pseudoduganella lutea TaxID=321985 RepID=A0A4V0Z3I3_9BURK|nr:hypothetical protein [Pseudoduganella lutea]QBE63543.1 hypothetical protein EWM63_11640 [Pseudoduganella lutea]